MTSALVLGGTGMLGDAVTRVLAAAGIDTVASVRAETLVPHASGTVVFDVASDDISAVLEAAGHPQYVINAIGIIKPHIDESEPWSRQQTIEVNSLFPYRLASAAAVTGSHVIQIATDCVYAGTIGEYDEEAPHDPLDVYGKTKSLGEAPHPNVTHLRCSIVGPERGRSTSLWEWVLGQPLGATITGYTNHFWNGITTDAFARICQGIIAAGWRESGTFHVVPSDYVSKATLVRDIARSNGRDDIVVKDGLAHSDTNRTLSTLRPDVNKALWSMAGYVGAPTISSLISEATR